MKITQITFAALIGMLLLLPRPAAAHHGWADFDEKKEVTVAATVSNFHFVNPHCVLEFTQTDKTGTVQKWQGEFSSPGVLAHSGWTAATLQPGEKITITGHPSKGSEPAIHVTKILMPDGKERIIH